MDELELADYTAILRRWKNHFLAVFLTLLAITGIFAMTWANYRSTATVEIQQPQIAAAMTTPTGMNASETTESLADLRVSQIEQKVTSPASLAEVISKFNLYPRAQKVSSTLLAKGMANKIKLNLIGSTIANPAASSRVSADQLSAIAFTLSFDYSDPKIAQQVNNELVTRFIDEDLNERQQEAQATSDLLDTQLKALEQSLTQQEQKIAQFQNEHGISGPEALLFNQQAAASAALSMQTIDSQIAANEGSQGSLRAQLSTVDPYSRVIADGQLLTTPGTQLKALESQYTTLTAQYGPDHPDVVKVRNQIAALRGETGNSSTTDTAALNAQIVDVQTNLSAAEKTYGDDNPDVLSLRHHLAELKNQLASAGKIRPHGGLKQDADNPAYLALVAQLNSLEAQHRSLLQQQQSLAAQQAKYEAALIKNPGLEQQMAALSRDHDNAQQRYRELKDRKMAADMDVQMIQDHKGQRLVVISPPDLPTSTHPSREMLFAAGLAFSLIGGLATVLIAQLLSQSVVGSRHLTSIVGKPPLITVPHLTRQTESAHG
jgi:uncharacterized protein involved in exopolysaccharide biosynthesis